MSIGADLPECMAPRRELATADFIRETLARAAARAELRMSVIRFVFCTLILLRFVWIHVSHRVPEALERGLIVVPVTLCGACFSLAVMWRARRREELGVRVLFVSVALDVVLCTAALASNVVWPWPEYRGLLALPDPLAYVLLIVAAGYRVWTRLAVWGSLASGVGLGALVGLDLQYHSAQLAYGANEITLYAVVLSCTAALSVAGAMRTQSLLRNAAEYGLQTAHAKRGMVVVLREHHDVMGYLSAVLRVAEKLEATGSAASDVAALRADLALLHGAVTSVKEQALAGVALLDRVVEVDIRSAVVEPRATYERLAAPMRVCWSLSPVPAGVRVAGGEVALRRVLANLLVNAREGDGRSGASAVVVKGRVAGAHYRIEVFDDGPGLSAVSVKARGSGVGLPFVRAVATASGGRFSLASSGRGTRAWLELPCVSVARPLGTLRAGPSSETVNEIMPS